MFYNLKLINELDPALWQLQQDLQQATANTKFRTPEMQQELEFSREISDSIAQIPLQQSEARQLLTETMQRLQSFQNRTSPLAEAKFSLLKAEAAAISEFSQ